MRSATGKRSTKRSLSNSVGPGVCVNRKGRKTGIFFRSRNYENVKVSGKELKRAATSRESRLACAGTCPPVCVLRASRRTGRQAADRDRPKTLCCPEIRSQEPYSIPQLQHTVPGDSPFSSVKPHTNSSLTRIPRIQRSKSPYGLAAKSRT